MEVFSGFLSKFAASPYSVIIDTEAVALIRHFITKFILSKVYTGNKENKKFNELFLLAIRVGVSCIAFFIYKKVTAIKDFQDEFTHIFLILFAYIMITRIFKLGDISFFKSN